MNFDQIFVNSDHPDVTTRVRVSEVESLMGIRFPEGYAEYVTTLGAGSLNDFVEVLLPGSIHEHYQDSLRSTPSRRSAGRA